MRSIASAVPERLLGLFESAESMSEHSLGLFESAEGVSGSVPDQAELDQPAMDINLETASPGRDASEESQPHAPASEAAHPRAPALLPENMRKGAFKGRAGIVQRKS